MTRANARDLAVHLIYGREFTGEEPESVVALRLEKEYYAKLSAENDVYAERPSRAQLAYIDSVVAGVANRMEDLNSQIQQYSIDFNNSLFADNFPELLEVIVYKFESPFKTAQSRTRRLNRIDVSVSCYQFSVR